MSTDNIYAEAESKVVFIGVEKLVSDLGVEKKAVNIIGSGFLVDFNGAKLISAAHVLSRAKHFSIANNAKTFIGVYRNKVEMITQFDLKTIDINKQIIDEQNDIGIVELDGDFNGKMYEKNRVKLTNDYLAGVKCVSIGYPLVNEFMAIGVGITLFLSGSMIASVKYNSQRKDIDFILTDSHINPSSSGSPFIEENTGMILGVVSGTFQNNFVDPAMAENKVSTGVQVPRNIGLIRPTYFLNKLIK